VSVAVIGGWVAVAIASVEAVLLVSYLIQDARTH
jgi:hypothetical protein